MQQVQISCLCELRDLPEHPLLIWLCWNCLEIVLLIASPCKRPQILSGLKEELHQWIESGFNSFEFTYEKGRVQNTKTQVKYNNCCTFLYSLVFVFCC